MPNPFRSKPTSFDVEIERVLTVMSGSDPRSTEYVTGVKNILVLTEAKDKSLSRKINANTVLTAATNFGGILAILSYENIHVISTKALGFVAKLRV
jgi:hypothetical protein